MGNSWMGAMTDVPHNVQTCSTDNAWTGAMTDESHDVQMG